LFPVCLLFYLLGRQYVSKGSAYVLLQMLLLFFHREISELRRPIDVKLRRLMESMLSFVILVTKFREPIRPKIWCQNVPN